MEALMQQASHSRTGMARIKDGGYAQTTVKS